MKTQLETIRRSRQNKSGSKQGVGGHLEVVGDTQGVQSPPSGGEWSAEGEEEEVVTGFSDVPDCFCVVGMVYNNQRALTTKGENDH